MKCKYLIRNYRGSYRAKFSCVKDGSLIWTKERCKDYKCFAPKPNFNIFQWIRKLVK